MSDGDEGGESVDGAPGSDGSPAVVLGNTLIAAVPTAVGVALDDLPPA